MSDSGEFRALVRASVSIIFSPVTPVIWAGCIVVAVLSGPFDTYATMGWPLRALYWGTVVTLAIFFGVAARAVAVRVVGFGRPLAFDLFATGLLAASFAPVIWLLRSAIVPRPPGTEVSLTGIAVNTFAIALGVFVLRRLFGLEPGSYRMLDEAPASREPRLRRRLPEDLQGDILHLWANDHSVRISTSEGEATLRIRLVDAIEEMEPVAGLCTHRSHWVARSAIVAVERESAQKMSVVLSNGERVPVSRTYRPRLVAAGLVAPPARHNAGSGSGGDRRERPPGSS